MVSSPVVKSLFQRGEQAKNMASTTNSSAQNVNNIWETMLQDAMRRNRLPDGTLLLVGPQGCGKSSLLDNFLEGSAASANPSGGAAALAAAGPAAVSPLVEKVPEGAAPAAGTVAGAVSAAAGVGTTAPSDTVGAANVRGFHPVLAYSYLDAVDLSEQGLERDDSPPRVSVWCCSELEFEDLLQTVMRPEQLANTAAVITVDLSRPWEVMDSVKKWTAVVERHMTRLLRLVPVTTQFDLKKAVKDRLKAARAGGEGEGNDHLEGELGEGFLERNIGIPLVVVGCKADSLQSDTFEQQQRLHFIQQSLRRFCLQYGAALVYTSAKDGVNCGLLHRYLLSCLYPDAFPCSDEGQTSDAVFIPAGWDSKRLIDHLLSPDKTPWGPEATFSDVVVPPPGVERREGANEKRGSWGKGSKAEAGEEKVDMVEPEGNWLSNLSKQFIDEKLQPSEPRRRQKSRSESKSPRVSTKGDPKSFFANLLANPNRPSRSPQG